MSIASGQLRERVAFYKRTVASDGHGNEESTFPDDPEFPAIAAKITPRLGGEAVLAGRLTGKEYVNITVRYSRDTKAVTEDWIVKDDRTGTVYNIRSIVNPDLKKTALEMLCEKGVAV